MRTAARLGKWIRDDKKERERERKRRKKMVGSGRMEMVSSVMR